MRYDAITNQNHHLYCAECKRVEDYEDEELNKILFEYFDKKKIKGFEIQDIKLNIIALFN